MEDKNKILKALRDRINYLVNEVNIDEDYVIMGIVNLFTKYLKDDVYKLGERIIENNFALKDFKEKFKSPMELLVKKQEEMMNGSNLFISKKNIYEWEVIREKYFNEYIRQIWENKRLLDMGKKFNIR